MPFSTKAGYLNSYPLMVQKLAKARARPVGSRRGDASQLIEGLPSNRVLQSEVLPLLMSVLCVALVTAVLLLVNNTLAVNLVPIAYLIPVIIAATQWGIWPATLASIASMAAADFFFFPPVYSFQVEDPQEVVDLLLFLVVALVSSNLASRLRRETETLRRREREILQLYEFSRRLGACFTVSDLISAIQNYLSSALGRQAAFFAASAGGHFEPPEAGALPKLVQENIASLIPAIGAPAHTIADEPTRDVWLLKQLYSETAVHGLVAVNIGGGSRGAGGINTRRA